MRVVYTAVPAEDLPALRSALDEEGVDCVVTEEAESDGEEVLVQFPLPTGAVEVVLDALRERGVDGEYTVVVTAETAETPRFAELEERFVTGQEEDHVATEELRSKARGLNPGRRTYYAMTVLSVLVATVGLLLDAPAVVVGSMVIAPQVGTALVGSLGIALSDTRLAIDGLSEQVLGLAVAVAAGALFGLLVKTAGFVPPALDVSTVSQISSRTSPGVLAVVVGLAAGAAGAFGLATDLPVSLVGVAVAAALIPAAGAIGIGLAWGFPVVALGAAVLLVTNLLTINAAGAVAFWSLGYRPPEWEGSGLLANLRAGRANATLLVVGLLVAAAVPTGASVAGQVAFENEATDAVGEVLAEEEYDALRLLEVRTEYAFDVVGNTRSLTVVVRHPAGERYPDLAGRLRDRVRERTAESVEVTVELVPVEHAEP